MLMLLIAFGVLTLIGVAAAILTALASDDDDFHDAWQVIDDDRPL